MSSYGTVTVTHPDGSSTETHALPDPRTDHQRIGELLDTVQYHPEPMSWPEVEPHPDEDPDELL